VNAAEFLFSSALVVKAGVDLGLPADALHFEDRSLPARWLECMTYLFAAAPCGAATGVRPKSSVAPLTQEREEV
jgi:hypothetical protein